MLIDNHLPTGIPKDAKVAYNGRIFKVYTWEQELFDGTKATFERVVVPDSVVIIPLTGHNSIVLAEQTQPAREPFIGFLGGRTKQSEPPLDAAKRELLEETGIIGKAWTKIGTWSPFFKVLWPQHYFIVRELADSPITHSARGEKINLMHLNISDFYDLLVSDNFHEYLFKSYCLSLILKHGKPNNFEDLFSLLCPE